MKQVKLQETIAALQETCSRAKFGFFWKFLNKGSNHILRALGLLVYSLGISAQ